MRLLALIACVWVLGAAAPSEQPQQRPESQQAAAHKAAASQAQTPLPKVGVAARQSIASSHAPKTEESEEGVELGSWPDWAIVVFTLVLTWVAILQHRLEARTARETIDALAIAKQSADAAKDSAVAYRLAERAHLSVTVVSLAVMTEGDEVLVRAVWTVENTGRTPGIITKVPISLSYPQPPPKGAEFPNVDTDNRIFVAPGRAIMWPTDGPTMRFSQNEWNEFRAEAHHIFVVGEVRYLDAHNEPHVSGFGYRVFQREMQMLCAPMPDAAFWKYS